MGGTISIGQGTNYNRMAETSTNMKKKKNKFNRKSIFVSGD